MTPETISWQAVVLAIVAGLPALLAALGALIVSLRQGPKLDQVIKATDGLTTALVKKTELASHAEGKAAGVIEGEADAHLRQLEKSAASTRREGDRNSSVIEPVPVKVIADENSPVPTKGIK